MRSDLFVYLFMLQVDKESKSITSSQYYYDMKYSPDYSTFSTMEMGSFSQQSMEMSFFFNSDTYVAMHEFKSPEILYSANQL